MISETSEISEVENRVIYDMSVGFRHVNTRSNDDDGRLVEGSGICGGGPCFVSWGVGGGVGSVSGASGRGTKFGGVFRATLLGSLS